MKKTFFLLVSASYTAIALAQEQPSVPPIAFCDISGNNACASPLLFDSSTIPTVISINGSFTEPFKEKNAISGELTLLHVESEKTATVKLKPTKDARFTSLNIANDDLASLPSSEWNQALTASIYSASLVPGQYKIVSAKVRFDDGTSSEVTFTPDTGATFEVKSNTVVSSGIVLRNNTGEIISRLTANPTGKYWAVRGYPALRDNTYQLEVNFGNTKKTVTFNLNRGIREFDIDLPYVDNLPNINTRILAVNNLQQTGIDGTYELINDSNEPVILNGQEVPPGSGINVTFRGGLAVLAVANNATDTRTKRVVLFNTEPDGENIALNLFSWKLEDQVYVRPAKDDVAIKVEPATLIPERKGTATKCNFLRTIRDKERLFEIKDLQCAIRWTDKGSLDLDPYRPGYLSGYVSNIGQNTFSYELGIVYTDPVTKVTNFYPSKNGSTMVSVNGHEPGLPQITFKNYDFYNNYYQKIDFLKNNPTKKVARIVPSDSTSGSLVGSVIIDAPYPGIRTRIESDNSREYYSSRPNATYAITSKITKVLDEKPVKITAWYEKAPEYKTELNLTVIGIPNNIYVFPNPLANAHTEENIILSGKIGTVSGGNILYDETLGKWQVEYYKRNPDGTKGDLIATATVDNTGKYSVDIGRLDAGAYSMIVVARLLDNQNNATAIQGSSEKVYYLNVYNGKISNLIVKLNKEEYLLPTIVTASLQFDNPHDSRVTNVKYWEVSTDNGQTWKQIDQKEFSFSFRPEERGEYLIRAHIENKYSKLAYTTEAVKFIGYQRGSISFEAPTVTAVGMPTEIFATIDGFGSNYEVKWNKVLGGGIENLTIEKTPTGSKLSFIPKTDGSYLFNLKVKDALTQQDNAAVTKAVSIKAVNPLVASATIKGPTYVEVGKTYHYTAQINDVVPSTVNKNYQVRGAWLMPDGSKVEATEIDYTIQPDQKGIIFVTWVDGLNEEKVNMLPLSTWTYQWPNWNLELDVVEKSVPAVIKYTLKPSVNLANLKGEPITVNWTLPDGVEIVERGYTGTLTFNQAGNFNVTATISDTRGNVTEIISPTIEILPAPQIEGETSIISPYGEGKFFAPGKYTIKHTITSMPRGDSFVQNELLINDQVVGKFYGTYAIAEITEPGNYKIGVRTITKLNNYGLNELQVNVAEAPKPTCTFTASQSSVGVSIVPVCSVEAGYPSTYEWSYLLNGQTVTSKTKSIYLKKVDLPKVMNLTVKVTTTLGATETFTVGTP